MEQSPSKQPKENPNPKHYLDNLQYEVNEIVTEQKDVKKKKVHYRKGYPGQNQIQPTSTFQISESDRGKLFLSDGNYEKALEYNKKDYRLGNEDQTSLNRRDRIYPYYEGAYSSYPTNDSKNTHKTRERLDNQKQKAKPTSRYDNEVITNKVSYGQQQINYEEPNQQGYNDSNQGMFISETPSLICKALNDDGEPVAVNNRIIRDKLILSCHPRRYYGPRGYLRRPVDSEIERDRKNIYQNTDVSIVDNVHIRQTTDVVYEEDKPSYLGTGKPTLERNDAFDLGSMGMGEHLTPTEDKDKQHEGYEEQYRALQCKRYERNFKGFLWSLLIISTLLVIVGAALLLLTLIHLLFRDYVNTVNAQTGFAMWIWAAMILSLLIIIVGVYGIITAIIRARKIIILFCLLAGILVLLILTFLLIFWLMHSRLNEIQQRSMNKTFNMYRCQRLVRVSWDMLHEKQPTYRSSFVTQNQKKKL